jgi:heterogeneous nuclear ribonucleoprotein K
LQKIGCRLKIFSNIAPQSTDRVAQIIGKEEQCIECLIEIMDLIKTVNDGVKCCAQIFQPHYFCLQTPIKGPVHNYDPHNFDDMYAEEYGGYGSGMNSGSNSFRNGNGGRGEWSFAKNVLSLA